MNDQTLYKAVLLDHFHNPRNKGDLDGMNTVARGSNPRCGDEIEVGINCDDGIIETVRFRGRGCSICIASASIMTECTTGITIPAARALTGGMQAWFDGENDTVPSEQVAALNSVRQHPARKKCVLIAWQALDASLDQPEDCQREVNR